MPPRTSFILVHGAWHGGWCWSKLASTLVKHGTVYAPDLPGSGASTVPASDVTVEDCTKSIVELIDRIPTNENIVLAGHSAGGAVITAAAQHRHTRISRLVYITAFALESGQSLNTASRGDKESKLGAEMKMASDKKTITLKSFEGARAVLYNDLAEQDARDCFSRLKPQSSAVFRGVVTTTPDKWGAVPKTYLVCTLDAAIGPAHQRAMATRVCGCAPVSLSDVMAGRVHGNGNVVVEMDAGHSPMVNRAEELTKVIMVGVQNGGSRM